MRLSGIGTALLSAFALLAASGFPVDDAHAAGKKKPRKTTSSVTSKVKGVGGYSYSYDDAIVEFRDGSVLRDPRMDPQGDPFDSGYFFDSNVTPWGSDAPYMN